MPLTTLSLDLVLCQTPDKCLCQLEELRVFTDRKYQQVELFQHLEEMYDRFFPLGISWTSVRQLQILYPFVVENESVDEDTRAEQWIKHLDFYHRLLQVFPNVKNKRVRHLGRMLTN